LPARLQTESGGWVNPDTARRFADYAAIVAARLGDRVKSFATHNEPWVTATLGYGLGVFAPGVRSRAMAAQASHVCLLSHGLAAQAVRSVRADAAVGIVLNLAPVYPATEAEADIAQARYDDGLLIRWYMDALLLGRYPADVLERLGADAPRVLATDAPTIAQPLDFIGVNFYNPYLSSAAESWTPANPQAPVTDMGWEVAPAELTKLLLRLDRDYGLPPMFVTENGAAYQDRVIDGRVEDEERRAYLESHMHATADALASGVDLRGYFVWSLFDNFEWAFGYSKRFGIFHIDYTTQARTPKRSALWYHRVLSAFRHRQATPARLA
jgi:beta-glucosidase